MELNKDKFVMLDQFKGQEGGCPMFYPDCPKPHDNTHIYPKDCCIIIGFLHGESMLQCSDPNINKDSELVVCNYNIEDTEQLTKGEE
jgi:hypothetical protein